MRFSFALVAALIVSGCARPSPEPTPAPVTVPAIRPAEPSVAAAPAAHAGELPPLGSLPPVPLVEGPLAIKVVYPSAGSPMANRDSNYMIGSVGNGRASLFINGQQATVYPNGSFMAFIRNPPVSNPQFTLVAANGPDTARLTHALRPPAVITPLPTGGSLVVDSSEFAPRAGHTLFLRDDEMTTVRIRIPSNANATLVPGQPALPLARAGRPMPMTRNGEIATLSVPAQTLREGGRVLVTRGSDTTTLRIAPVPGPLFDAPQFVRLGRGMTPADTDAVVYGRVLPNDNYKWFFLPGTVAELTGRSGGYSRIRVASDLELWVADADVDSAPAARPARRTTANGRVRSGDKSADLVIPMTSTPPFFVEQHERQVHLVLYGTVGNTDIINYPTNERFIESVTWEQETSDRIRFVIHLADRPTGFMALWERGALVLRVRRPPVVNPADPLRGRTIALDPGHPPAGATGPTSLYEGTVALQVAQRAKAMLEARGATVVMTRTTMDTLGLPPRRSAARRADAEAFVSIHLNAFPDGINPFTATTGTGTYFYRTHAEPLARTIQQRMLHNMALRDEGVFFRSLAVTVQSWMPAVLLEGAYMIIPEQEAALRTAEYQDRYARSIVEGLARYFSAISR